MQEVSIQQVNGENYRWWQQAGWQWYAELQLRRLSDPLYDRQEALLKQFFRDLAARHQQERKRPLRVLEYGCGFGRHVKYLHQIDDVEIYGCDQSPGMLSVAGTLLFGRFPELEERLLQVKPNERLPWDDGFFDVVFTVSVLMHVAPDDLQDRVAELRRVADGMLLNIEFPSPPQSFLWDGAHNGCWLHDLLGAHRAAGPCEIEVDADALAPAAAVYHVRPASSDGGVRVLRAGEWREGDEPAREALLDAVLEYGRFCRDRTQESIEKERRVHRKLAAINNELRENEARLRWTERQLKALQHTRAVRIANWLGEHRVLRAPVAVLFDRIATLRRGVGRLLGGDKQHQNSQKQPEHTTGEETETSEGADE